jgi:hypothetical protein
MMNVGAAFGFTMSCTCRKENTQQNINKDKPVILAVPQCQHCVLGLGGFS